jgi:hypothetical protein
VLDVLLISALAFALLSWPFIATIAVARRVSGASRPSLLSSISATLFFVVAASFIRLIWLRAGGSNGHGQLIAALGFGSLGAAWTVWALTHRRALAAFVVLAAAAASPFFIWIEAGTHGPWYIQSEMAAIMGSMAATALAWHLVVGLVLLAWARGPGRREFRTRAGKCIACGYDLRGTPAALCPECGRSHAPDLDHQTH